MDRQKLESIMRATLADHRASRGERKAFSEVLNDQHPSENDLAYLRHLAFRLTKEEIDAPVATEVLGWLEEMLKMLTGRTEEHDIRNRVYFSPADDCVSVIRGLFQRSRSKVDICVFTITDNQIAEAILDAHRRNISVRIITDDDKSMDLGSDITSFRRAGIEVKCDQCEHHMHHKFAIFDGQVVLTGSYNWTRGAAINNQENMIGSDDGKLAAEFGFEFEKLWKEL